MKFISPQQSLKNHNNQLNHATRPNRNRQRLSPTLRLRLPPLHNQPKSTHHKTRPKISRKRLPRLRQGSPRYTNRKNMHKHFDRLPPTTNKLSNPQKNTHRRHTTHKNRHNNTIPRPRNKRRLRYLQRQKRHQHLTIYTKKKRNGLRRQRFRTTKKNMTKTLATCSRKCPAYYFSRPVEICRLEVNKDMNPPFCYSGFYNGNTCKHLLTREQIDDIWKIRKLEIDDGEL